MKPVTPNDIFAKISGSLRADIREHIIVIGSLAAGYHFFHADASVSVQTKDIDCVLEPFATAVGVGRSIHEQLTRSGWSTVHPNGMPPGNEETPEDQLPAIRMYPPPTVASLHNEWFLELLTLPEHPEIDGRTWTKVLLRDGYYGLPSFRFLPIATFEPILASAHSLFYAQPKMMALANLLEHPMIRPEYISAPIANRIVKRSNKDLGRAVAIAHLSGDRNITEWPLEWRRALTTCRLMDWSAVSRNMGDGLRALLKSDSDLEEALHTCNSGLLSSNEQGLRTFRAAGERLLADAVEPLERMAST